MPIPFDNAHVHVDYDGRPITEPAMRKVDARNYSRLPQSEHDADELERKIDAYLNVQAPDPLKVQRAKKFPLEKLDKKLTAIKELKDVVDQADGKHKIASMLKENKNAHGSIEAFDKINDAFPGYLAAYSPRTNKDLLKTKMNADRVFNRSSNLLSSDDRVKIEQLVSHDTATQEQLQTLTNLARQILAEPQSQPVVKAATDALFLADRSKGDASSNLGKIIASGAGGGGSVAALGSILGPIGIGYGAFAGAYAGAQGAAIFIKDHYIQNVLKQAKTFDGHANAFQPDQIKQREDVINALYSGI